MRVSYKCGSLPAFRLIKFSSQITLDIKRKIFSTYHQLSPSWDTLPFSCYFSVFLNQSSTVWSLVWFSLEFIMYIIRKNLKNRSNEVLLLFVESLILKDNYQWALLECNFFCLLVQRSLFGPRQRHRRSADSGEPITFFHFEIMNSYSRQRHGCPTASLGRESS